MSTIVVRGAYAFDADAVSNEYGVARNEDDDKTHQSFKDECDINTIVRRFGLTGDLPNDLAVPQYGDFTGIGDYQSALNAVMKAEADFLALPADLRARFENDPQRLMDFVHDAGNREEAVKLGLLQPAPARDVVTAVDELASVVAKSGLGDVAKP